MSSRNIFSVILRPRKFISVLFVLLLVELAAPAPTAHNSILSSRLNDPCTHNRSRHVRNVHSRNATCMAIAVARDAKKSLRSIYKKDRSDGIKVSIPLQGKLNKKYRKLNKLEKLTENYYRLREYVEAFDYMSRQKLTNDEKIEKDRKEQFRRVGNFGTALLCEINTQLRQNNVTLEPVKPHGTTTLKKFFLPPKPLQVTYLHEQDYKVLDKFNKFVPSINTGAKKCPRVNRKNNKRKKNRNKKVQPSKKTPVS